MCVYCASGTVGQSVFSIFCFRAAAIMMHTGPVVTLQVAKFGASYHGLGALLSEPTPKGPTGQNRICSAGMFFNVMFVSCGLIKTVSFFTR